MKRIAIIGSGIAGLGCAYFLQRRFDITLFEKNDYAGGHTNTIEVDESGQKVPIDTGFMVFNTTTYPNLTRLFNELNVVIKPTDMSFSVQHIPENLEWCGSGFNHLFAQRENLFKPRFWKMLLNLDRFNKDAQSAMTDVRYADCTIGEYVELRGYGQDFLKFYLIPMASAVWSTPPGPILEFPAQALLRFFHNHGFNNGLDGHLKWLTVAGGAKEYVKKLTAPFAAKIIVGKPVSRIIRQSNGVRLVLADGSQHDYDAAILAAHADQSLAMIEDPQPLEKQLLSTFKYQDNRATLHTDSTLMPRRKLCWASWNYRYDTGPVAEPVPSTHYWMNNLQQVSQHKDYFVSINAEDKVKPEKIIRSMDYEHPIFSLPAIKAQPRLPELNKQENNQRLYFCGSYFRNGFHEDAFSSALDLARIITQEAIWQ